MPLETATYINDLVSTNPIGSEETAQGDDHIRLIKAAIKATFPNITGAMTATHTVLNGLDARATAIEAAYIKKDGSVAMTGALAMGSQKITDLATPTADTDAATKAYIDTLVSSSVSAAKQALFPVGSLYINANVTTNPATLLGFGTWSQVSQGRVLIGVGTGNDGTDTQAISLGGTGGFYKHTLTAAELPSHQHKMFGAAEGSLDGTVTITSDSVVGASGAANTGARYAMKNVSGQVSAATIGQTAAIGSGNAHNNIQPYLGVYIWKRTA